MADEQYFYLNNSSVQHATALVLLQVIATSVLNNAQPPDHNWDQVDDGDQGVSIGFNKASENELKRRPMKTAKRSLPNGDNNKPFQSFMMKPLLAPVAPPPLLQMATPIITPQTNGDSKFIQKLCELNKSVTKWISDHVAKNPCIDLSPIFEDYKKYLKQIEDEEEKEEEEDNQPLEDVRMNTEINKQQINKQQDEMEEEKHSEEEEEEEEEEDRKMQPQNTEMANTSTINSNDQQVKSLPIAKPDEDCLHACRCKLFYKKADSYVELGLGNLRVEGPEDGNLRLLIRNDTSLKQILLNVRINNQNPLMLQKNSVLLVCLPNPPLVNKSPEKDSASQTTPTPVTYMLRVRDAKGLFDSIKTNL